MDPHSLCDGEKGIKERSFSPVSSRAQRGTPLVTTPAPFREAIDPFDPNLEQIVSNVSNARESPPSPPHR